ncbi:hypothetical protein CTAYLR_000578 [Chrysophaeum taylorii]|uniref:Uncharacterized protein n=1 Tax=Chrysophaeum taylorii TaxID=2483200 RepID=A0AAD7UIU0_9STRA|nr:hypothetical protein CTAYLR_000578 [Chrysophaeum taylorii]
MVSRLELITEEEDEEVVRELCERRNQLAVALREASRSRERAAVATELHATVAMIQEIHEVLASRGESVEIGKPPSTPSSGMREIKEIVVVGGGRGCWGSLPVTLGKTNIRRLDAKEVTTLLRIRSHPNILQLYGVCAELECFVLERAWGTLGERIERRGIPTRLGAAYGLDVVGGLQHLQALGLGSDLDTSNIVVAVGALKLTSFSRHHDLQSLGNVMYEIATRKKPRRRGSFPKDCGGPFADIVEQCWGGQQALPPSLERFRRRLRATMGASDPRSSSSSSENGRFELLRYWTESHARAAEAVDHLTRASIPRLVADLKNGGNGALGAVTRLSAKKDKTAVASAGAIPPLIDLLNDSPVEAAAHLVWDLAAKNDANKAALAGAIPPLVEMLRRSRSSTAAAALCVLATVDANKVLVAWAGGIPALVNVLSTKNSHYAAAALFQLATNANYRGPIARAGAIPPLVDLLSRGSDAGKREAARALSSLALHDDNKFLVVAGVGPLVSLVKSGTPVQQDVASACLRNFALNSAINKRTIIKLGGVPALVDLAKRGTPYAKEQALVVLQLLGREHRNKKKR